MKNKIILASSSPRRKELLTAMGVAFDVRPPQVNEDPLEGESPLDTQHRITREKARAVDGASAIVIACDTTVLLDGEMLNKPQDAGDARRMLRALRNRAHEVQSCVVTLCDGEERVSCDSSMVHMRDYTDAEIEEYIASGDPFDKAGSYAVQHEAFHPVARMRGCPLNVIGLPLCHLRQLLPHLPDPAPVCRAIRATLPPVDGAMCG
ncbi:MAG TPA: Maf family protein [Thermoflexales bacterium]|nr:Maf family protein [Thermoflexales bacterium]HQZ22929.1 Maf family protein [Thermoflexales bacterium]HRA01254.1 Maf family protein [Thermoflexales bacterium]